VLRLFREDSDRLWKEILDGLLYRLLKGDFNEDLLGAGIFQRG
jgi:hypothetical protein